AHKKPDSDTARLGVSISGSGSPPDPPAPHAPAHPSQSSDHGLADITPTRLTPRLTASYAPSPPDTSTAAPPAVVFLADALAPSICSRSTSSLPHPKSTTPDSDFVP